jgi:hypothetical protein
MTAVWTYPNTRRVPAVPHQHLDDPAGWNPDDLRDTDRWAYYFTERDVAELIDGVAAVRRAGVPLVDIAREHFPLKGVAEVMEHVRRELLDGRGVVRLRNFPVDRLGREGSAIAYLGLGAYLGARVPQNKYGHLLGHVKDMGHDRAGRNTRGYTTSQAMSFHVDSTDFVGLLCLHGAKSGGDSRVASSVTIYNRILEERPDLIDALMMDFYKTRYGEVNPGEAPYYKTPIFSFVDGYFSALGYSSGFDKAQGLPGVPDFTAQQREAMPVYRRICEEVALDMPFTKGDIQFLNNYVMVHSRHGFEDWPEAGRKRHLMRLWLNDPVGRPIPQDRRGRRDFGVRMKGVPLTAPLDMTEAA